MGVFDIEPLESVWSGLFDEAQRYPLVKSDWAEWSLTDALGSLIPPAPAFSVSRRMAQATACTGSAEVSAKRSRLYFGGCDEAGEISQCDRYPERHALPQFVGGITWVPASSPPAMGREMQVVLAREPACGKDLGSTERRCGPTLRYEPSAGGDDHRPRWRRQSDQEGNFVNALLKNRALSLACCQISTWRRTRRSLHPRHSDASH